MARPGKSKYRKEFKGRVGAATVAGSTLVHGMYGLKVLEPARLNEAVIEAARRVISRRLNRGGKIWITVFPHTPVSKKPADVRMGRGKGGVEFYVARVRPGRIIFEITGVARQMAMDALSGAMPKLGVKAVIVENMVGGVIDGAI